jgi:predicted CoA-binding protein
MPSIREAASEFLANKRVAVTGVSRTPNDHGSNVVYRRLRERGYEVFAVNPNAHEVEGDPSYHDLRTIPGGVDAVVIGTRPEIASRLVAMLADPDENAPFRVEDERPVYPFGTRRHQRVDGLDDKKTRLAGFFVRAL